MTALLPAFTLWQREMVRFFRQPNRIVGAIGSPLLFWFLIGSGVGRSFGTAGSADDGYLIYIFPGTLVLIVLFTAIFSTISIIEDRREGFLQSVLVAPVPRSVVVLGKVMGGASLAFVQAILFLALAPTIGLRPDIWTLLLVLLMIGLIGMQLTSLGFLIAWRMQSIQGFHAIMNLFLLPLWLLSGALFPPSGAATWVQWLIRVNPLTYSLGAIRHLLIPGDASLAGLPGFGVCLGLTLLFTVTIYAAASFTARGHTSGDLL